MKILRNVLELINILY